MKYISGNSRPVFIIIILFIVILFSQGCYYYRAVSTKINPSEVIEQHASSSENVILYFGKVAWEFSEIKISGDSIKGSIKKLQDYEYYTTTRTGKAHRYKKSKPESIDQKDVLDQVHITISEYIMLETNELLIFTDWIENIKVNKPATGATITSWVVSGVGAAVTVFVGFVLISMQVSGYLF